MKMHIVRLTGLTSRKALKLGLDDWSRKKHHAYDYENGPTRWVNYSRIDAGCR